MILFLLFWCNGNFWFWYTVDQWHMCGKRCGLPLLATVDAGQQQQEEEPMVMAKERSRGFVRIYHLHHNGKSYKRECICGNEDFGVLWRRWLNLQIFDTTDTFDQGCSSLFVGVADFSVVKWMMWWMLLTLLWRVWWCRIGVVGGWHDGRKRPAGRDRDRIQRFQTKVRLFLYYQWIYPFVRFVRLKYRTVLG